MQITSAKFLKGIIGTDPILSDTVPQIAFVGRSNVGKSSVINSLVNRKDLVKTSQTPGKTREINFFSINNNAFYFVDLPGYGYAKGSPKEKESIEKLILWYLMYSGAKPLKVVLILDSKAGFTAFDGEMVRVLREHGHPLLIVINKIDKLTQKETASVLRSTREGAHEAFVASYSALSGKGSSELLEQIFEQK